MSNNGVTIDEQTVGTMYTCFQACLYYEDVGSGLCSYVNFYQAPGLLYGYCLLYGDGTTTQCPKTNSISAFGN